MQVCLPLMKKQGYGRIVNMSSGVAQLSVRSLHDVVLAL